MIQETNSEADSYQGPTGISVTLLSLRNEGWGKVTIKSPV